MAEHIKKRKNRAANDDYRRGWERTFGKVKDLYPWRILIDKAADGEDSSSALIKRKAE